jgi:hypothetical protein
MFSQLAKNIPAFKELGSPPASLQQSAVLQYPKNVQIASTPLI